MKHSAKILADSISPVGIRLTTMEICLPRIVLAEFNTHRMFSRNSASSRAIPTQKMLQMVLDNPYVPDEWGTNQKGMQAGQPLSPQESDRCVQEWLCARDQAVASATALLDRGVHKQLTNRLLEPFMWHTIIVSATDWDNFFHLRCHKDAHPDIRKTAELMRDAMEKSTPNPIALGSWHLPLIFEEDFTQVLISDPASVQEKQERLIKVSVGRCARVSYLTHDGKRDHEADIALHDRLLDNGHMSPLEHVAAAQDNDSYSGNFRGWLQYRKTIPHERDLLGHL